MIGFDLKLTGLHADETAFTPARVRPSPQRIAAYVAVIAVGLFIGAVLGLIAALFSGVIGVC